MSGLTRLERNFNKFCEDNNLESAYMTALDFNDYKIKCIGMIAKVEDKHWGEAERLKDWYKVYAIFHQPHYTKKMGKKYFKDLTFNNFEDYSIVVFDETWTLLMKEEPLTWFVTIDQEPYTDDVKSIPIICPFCKEDYKLDIPLLKPIKV